ncbi:MAG: PP2C family protein-serine/threonine phosphatase [Acidobacteria bacterium]|nr:PP2C family protein-serine/threonine phosphatase [Acidobacteriota bacterium]
MVHVSVSRLESLLESAQLLHASLDLDDLLKHLLRTVMGRLLVTRAVIAIDADEGLRVAMARGVPEAAVGSTFDAARATALGLTNLLPIGSGPAVGLLATAVPARPAVDDEERAFLDALLGIAATGISNANAHTQATRLNRDLDRKIQELRTLMEIGRAFSQVTEVEEVARILGLTLSGQWMVSRYAIVVCRDALAIVSRQQGVKLPPLATYMDALHRLPDAALVDDLQDEDVRALFQSHKLRAVFALRGADQVCGFAALGPRPGGQIYTQADLELGAGMAAQAVVAFDNCWHLREMVEKKQYEKELAVAADIQQGLFPARLPDLPGFDISAMNRPAQQVGGDYYDVLTLTDHGADACLFCVADVSGKGLAASLLMSTIQATLRALLGREPSLSALAARTSDLLFATTPGSKYATAALVLADTASGECRYVSGGHTETLLLRASGERTWFGATGVPLGLFPDMAWDQVTFTLQPGDVLVLYSDGVSEAQTATFDEFGPERLADIVDRQRWRPAQEITAAILAAIDAFVEGAPQFDDITLMVIKRE